MADATVQRLAAFNRRTLDVLTARIYSYFSLGHERTGTLPKIRRWAFVQSVVSLSLRILVLQS